MTRRDNRRSRPSCEIRQLCVSPWCISSKLVPHVNGRSVAVVGLRVLEIDDLGSLCPAPAYAWRLVWLGGRVAGRGQG